MCDGVCECMVTIIKTRLGLFLCFFLPHKESLKHFKINLPVLTVFHQFYLANMFYMYSMYEKENNKYIHTCLTLHHTGEYGKKKKKRAQQKISYK